MNSVKNQVDADLEDDIRVTTYYQTRDIWLQVRLDVYHPVKNLSGVEVHNKVWEQVWSGTDTMNSVNSQVNRQVNREVDNQVDNQVWNQVDNQVWSGIKHDE